MNKKVVVFGGGTGMSYLLRGLKEYPLDIKGSNLNWPLYFIEFK